MADHFGTTRPASELEWNGHLYGTSLTGGVSYGSTSRMIYSCSNIIGAFQYVVLVNRPDTSVAVKVRCQAYNLGNNMRCKKRVYAGFGEKHVYCGSHNGKSLRVTMEMTCNRLMPYSTTKGLTIRSYKGGIGTERCLDCKEYAASQYTRCYRCFMRHNGTPLTVVMPPCNGCGKEYHVEQETLEQNMASYTKHNGYCRTCRQAWEWM